MSWPAPVFDAVLDGETATAALAWAARVRGPVAYDLETTGLGFQANTATLLSVADDRRAWVFDPCSPAAVDVMSVLADRGIELVAHNETFDAWFAQKAGLALSPWRGCTLTLAKLAYPLTGEYRLGQLARTLNLGEDKPGPAWDWPNCGIHMPDFVEYGALDAILCRRLHDVAVTKLTKGTRSIWDVERRVQTAMDRAAKKGLEIHEDNLAACKGWAVRQERQIVDHVHTHYGIDPGSPKQVAAALQRCGWTPGEADLTDTGGPSTSYAVLSRLTGHQPLATAVLRWRLVHRINVNYCDAFAAAAAADGALHPEIRVSKAKTGRMSMADPNLQQVIRSPRVKGLIRARRGHLLVFADYSNMEYRMAASLTGDDNLAKLAVGDAHTIMCEQLFGIDETAPDFGAKRQITKGFNFGIFYGAGPETLAENTGLSFAVAEELYGRWHAANPGVKDTIRELDRQPRYGPQRQIYVNYPTGRVVCADDGRLGFNYLIQGTCADVMKQAIVRVDDSDLAEMIRLPVHDELILEAPAEDAEEVAYRLAALMEDRGWKVPLTCDPAVGHTWGDKKDLSGG